MSTNFGEAKKAGEGTVRKVFTGVENFKITSVNPSHEALKVMFGDGAREPKYITQTKLEDGSEFSTIKIDLYLDNEDEENPIKTRVTYFVQYRTFNKTDGTGFQVINMFGQTYWMTPEEFEAKNAVYSKSGPKGTYTFDATGMRKSLRGEDTFIAMLRNLLNLGSPAKAADKNSVASQFSMADWKVILNGNFSLIEKVIKSSPNKIGFLMGAKTVEANVYQDIYTRNSLRQYSKAGGNFKWLNKDVASAQGNGGYGSTDFGDLSRKIAEYYPDATPTSVTEVKKTEGFAASASAFGSASESFETI